MTDQALIADDYVIDATPTEKLLYVALRQHGPCTQNELVELTGTAPRTARLRLRELVEAGVVEKRPNIHDARQSLYSLATPSP
ncbi:MarR family transcriptional regulator [Halosimplex pelagicum]|uniref:MarR family transcriptional regulator n=1 Tax=Halosimplex pelagicum TaxID=869886 RepID=A0A7D5P509_9EURY|nr:helix-turn-helix domain-containing protein [Halosimplex pelagicum]QLH80963.1 MarR family transcriptional regulator [Halosimplex pelagicum]